VLRPWLLATLLCASAAALADPEARPYIAGKDQTRDLRYGELLSRPAPQKIRKLGRHRFKPHELDASDERMTTPVGGGRGASLRTFEI